MKENLEYSGNSLSSFAGQVLLKLQKLGCGSISKDGKIVVGRLIAPASVGQALLARDFVYRRDNMLVINDVGLAYIRRMEHLSATPSVGGNKQTTPYIGQHSVSGKKAIKESGSRKIYKTNLGETPLGWLLRRKGRDGKTLITMEQFLAGERLREDFEMSGISPHVTRNYDAIVLAQGRATAHCGMSILDHTIAAKKRLDSALYYVGPGLKDVLLRTCCHLEGLEMSERALGWPQRSGKVVLSIALTRLACHYNNHIG